MNNKLGLRLFTSALLGLGTLLAIANTASAATLFWDIELLDESGTQVGTGEFSYDPETVETLRAFGVDGVSGFNNFNETNVLESLSIELLGEEINFDPSDKWWSPNSVNAMRQIQEQEFGDGTIEDSWILLDGFAIPSGFTLSGSSTQTTGQGTWSFTDFGFITPNSPLASLQGVSIAGTWNASLQENTTDPDSDSVATPESSTLFGVLALAGMGLAATKKKS